VRVKQHQAIIDEKMLDPETTVMAIWPAPMIYAGPTEVQFHASSRRNAGCAYFVVGRDAAGMKGSLEAEAHYDDDLYKGEHARYVLQMSPVLEDSEMGLISFDKFFYDKMDHQMKGMDDSRPDDFISISGSKMRALARQGAVPCTDPIPSDLLAANCVPQGFMVQKGWDIVVDYYQNKDNPSSVYIPWSKAVVSATADAMSETTGQFGTLDFRLLFKDAASSAIISPWHDISLLAPGSSPAALVFNFIVEIPMFQTAKMEVSKELPSNPIIQDSKKGLPRYYGYGTPFFNYGLLPQTWEDPAVCKTGDICGDDDPLDVIEVGSEPMAMGSVVPAKVLGALELIDEGETDYKIIMLRLDDKDAAAIHDMATLEQIKPGTTARLVDWLKKYKTAEGKGLNTLASEIPYSISESYDIITECNDRWFKLVTGSTPNSKGHYIKSSATPALTTLTGSSSGASEASPVMAPVTAPVTAPAKTAAVGLSGDYEGCMSKCKELEGLQTMQEACVHSCIDKYGRRRNLRRAQ